MTPSSPGRRHASWRPRRATRCSSSTSTAASTEQRLEALPPTIESVLAARIDGPRAGRADGARARLGRGPQLPPRRTRRAGRRTASAMPSHPPLLGLVRKQLIRPDPPEFAGEDAFRFAHALIREVAYGGIPKRLRADLHERLAQWLRPKPRVRRGPRPPPRAGVPPPARRRLRGRARPRACRGGVRAAGVGRTRSAQAQRRRRRSAAARACGGARPGQRRQAHAALLAALGAALIETGRLADADSAPRGGDRASRRSRATRASRRAPASSSSSHGSTSARAPGSSRPAASPTQRSRASRAATTSAARAPGACAPGSSGRRASAANADAAWDRAATHARRAGEERELFEILGWQASAAVFGPLPVSEAIRRCEWIREQVRSSPVAVAVTLHPLGLLHAMTGQFERARRLIREGNAILDELGGMESAVSHHEVARRAPRRAGPRRPRRGCARATRGSSGWASGRCSPPPRGCSRRRSTPRAGMKRPTSSAA